MVKKDNYIVKTSFINRVNLEEKLAVIRSNNIRQKYKELNNKKKVERLDLIYKTSYNDLDLAINLQKFYYLRN